MSVIVRPAVPADAPLLAEVHVAAWHETYDRVVDDEVSATFDVAERTTVWTRALNPERAGEGVIVVAESGSRIVGFAHAMPPRHSAPARDWELGSLYTLASVHGTGVGAALMAAAIGDRPAEVWLLTGNSRATAFYRKHGFVEDGVTGFFDRWQMPEKRMVR